jgi:hypothetical protein
VQIYVPSTTIGASLKTAYTATCLLHEFAVRTQRGAGRSQRLFR